MSTDRPTSPGRARTAVLLSVLVGASRSPASASRSSARGRWLAVATVTQESGFGPSSESVAEGSGFVLDEDGRIVTNDHVVEGATEIDVAFADGTKADATLLATDPLLDLAVIQVDVDAATLAPLRLGEAETLRVGEAVVAIGSPFGLERSVSAGIVSALGRQITAPNGFTLSNAIQTDAAINHGNSGGPLLDEDGQVIGVNAQIADSGVDANVGTASPSRSTRRLGRRSRRWRAARPWRTPGSACPSTTSTRSSRRAVRPRRRRARSSPASSPAGRPMTRASAEARPSGGRRCAVLPRR